ncbi:hypothetical protein F4804DRAFT_304379 [Jackrogersella minutella]|nr:hypothetical protein F4804DRAFT_304379 [Jackrogersella minutella]
MATILSNPQGKGVKTQLSQREIEITALAWMCITSVKNGVPKVDANKLAKIGNYASADSARHIWRPIEKKLTSLARSADADAGDAAAASSKASGPAATPGKTTASGRKRKVDADTDGGGDSAPSKKPRGRKPSKAKAKKESDEEAGELDNGGV